MTSGGIIFSSTENLITKNFSVDPASISVRKLLFSSKQHRFTRRNNSLHPGYLTSLVTRTNHNTLQTIGIYVRVFRTADHAVQIFIPHRRPNVPAPKRPAPRLRGLGLRNCNTVTVCDRGKIMCDVTIFILNLTSCCDV